MRDQLIWQESAIRQLTEQNDKLTGDLRATSVELKATGQLLGARVGVAPDDLDQRANDLAQRQQAIDAAAAKAAPHPQTQMQTPAPAAPAPQHSYLRFFEPGTSRGTQEPIARPSYLHFFSGSTPAAPRADSGAPALPKGIEGTHPAEPDLTAPRLGTVHAPPRKTTETPAQPAATAAPMTTAAHPPPLPVFAPRAGYTDPMEENIAEVSALQRSSGRRLEEFHVHEGKVTMPLPNLGLEVKRPNEKHGTYTLVVKQGKEQSEIKGRVNEPLLVAQWPNGQQCQLVVLSIRNGQIYGYLAGIR